MNDDPQIVIESEEVISFLKQEMRLKEVYNSILWQRAIARVAQEQEITISTDEIQAEADRQRRELRLEKAADTLLWLNEQRATPEEWEIGIRNRLLAQKVAEKMFGKEVEKFFIQNRLEFEQIVLYQMVLANDKLAQELYFQIEEGEVSFYAAAHTYDIDEKRRQKCGYEGAIYRWALEADIASIVFNTSPKQLIGPLRTEQGYHLFWVEELIAAELTPQRYQEILNHMFKQWLNAEVETILNHSL
ncbi:peptidylprolyl isomerase [Calothrix sp. UHCC 0171]|uniref:peptidylprolyl isomerase n=1 Tax=Calothrix sp. UHCC 0171 TaxID=3110245 RepID=UPI002B1FD124|nr:peptidylprolyl isomerase [Calothrix sp. UHCC 0171]MEA5570920.1 peptidylprolyl isomerase [Calothrix sp. UHCC 0171]